MPPTSKKRPEVEKFLNQGFTVAQVAKLTDLTTQRVYQIKWSMQQQAKQATPESDGEGDA